MIRIFSGPEKISPLGGAPKAGWQIFIFDWILLSGVVEPLKIPGYLR